MGQFIVKSCSGHAGRKAEEAPANFTLEKIGGTFQFRRYNLNFSGIPLPLPIYKFSIP
jgi:hypothetical protein